MEAEKFGTITLSEGLDGPMEVTGFAFQGGVNNQDHLLAAMEAIALHLDKRIQKYKGERA